MTLFPMLALSGDEQLSILILIMIVRACYQQPGDYDTGIVPWEWLSREIPLGFVGMQPPTWVATIYDVVSSCKINLFSLDATTNVIRKSVQAAASLTNRFHAAVILAKCSSRKFAETFFECGAHSIPNFRAKIFHTLSVHCE